MHTERAERRGGGPLSSKWTERGGVCCILCSPLLHREALGWAGASRAALDVGEGGPGLGGWLAGLPLRLKAKNERRQASGVREDKLPCLVG